MVVKAEQERVKTLIADTVSLLCKNGLHYTKEFSIEGLLGITLDRDEVFLVNIKELVKSEFQQDSDSEQSDEVPSKSSSKRKRRRSKSKRTEGGDADETSNDTNASFAQPASVDNSSEPPAKKSSIKEERTEEESDDEDLVFIKDEPGQDFSAFSSGDQSFSGAHSNNILGDLSQQGSLYATPTSAGNLASTSGWDPSHAAAAAFSQQPLSSQPNTPNTSGQQQRKRLSAFGMGLALFECEICGALFKSNTGFNSHLYDKHGLGKKGRVYTCDVCGRTIRNKSAYKTHVLMHKNERQFKCDKCEKEYAYKKDLRNHQLAKHTTEEEKPHCQLCNKHFNYEANLVRHLQSVHSSNPILFTCIVHNLTYASKGALARHFRSHQPDEGRDWTKTGDGAELMDPFDEGGNDQEEGQDEAVVEVREQALVTQTE